MSMEQSIIDQLNDWYNGVSTHNTERNECCPDFSCCNREIKTPFLIREKFCNALKSGDTDTVNEMLSKFLQNMVNLEKRKGKIE